MAETQDPRVCAEQQPVTGGHAEPPCAAYLEHLRNGSIQRLPVGFPADLAAAQEELLLLQVLRGQREHVTLQADEPQASGLSTS